MLRNAKRFIYVAVSGNAGQCGADTTENKVENYLKLDKLENDNENRKNYRKQETVPWFVAIGRRAGKYDWQVFTEWRLVCFIRQWFEKCLRCGTDRQRNLRIEKHCDIRKYQGNGYGKALIIFISDFYKNDYKTMLVGTGETPTILSFYESCGFEKSYRVKNFFTDNYDHPMFDGEIQLVDMIYLKKDL